MVWYVPYYQGGLGNNDCLQARQNNIVILPNYPKFVELKICRRFILN